jgi:hypothetical protein
MFSGTTVIQRTPVPFRDGGTQVTETRVPFTPLPWWDMYMPTTDKGITYQV